MRYVPATPEETQAMLQSVGLQEMAALYADIPPEVRLNRPLAMDGGLAEQQLMREMTNIAAKNKVYRDIFMGAGAYKHFIPAVVDAVSARGEFLTAYTPYQPEMSQGILQNIFEFQTMICELTGMDVSNASVYDGASAAGEACLMLRDCKRDTVLVSAAVNPQTLQTIRTYAIPAGMQVRMVGTVDGTTDLTALQAAVDETTAGVLLQSPNYFGLIEDMAGAAGIAHNAGAKLVASVNPIACALLKTPGELGADIAVGDGQPLGLPLAFGGPYLGFMACKQEWMRKLPGRIVGKTADHEGRREFVLTLQAREQHIRREKAGSNICSNQAWCALRCAVYMVELGRQGLREVALQCWANAHYLQEQLGKAGFGRIHNGEFFHEFATFSPAPAAGIQAVLDAHGILGGLALGEHQILWCATELTGKDEIDRLVGILKGVAK